MYYYTPINLRRLINTPPCVFATLDEFLTYLRVEQTPLWALCDQGTVAVVQQPTGLTDLPFAVIRYAPGKDRVLLGYLTRETIDDVPLPQWDPLNHILVYPSLS